MKVRGQETVFERMGIKPGICKCCGGKMVVVDIIPNRFRASQRAPPQLPITVNVCKAAV